MFARGFVSSRVGRPIQRLKWRNRTEGLHLTAPFSPSSFSSSSSIDDFSSNCASAIATTSSELFFGCERVIDFEVPEGHCVGFALHDLSQDDPNSLTKEAIASSQHWIRRYLHPKEIEYALEQPSASVKATFLLGRLALRNAFQGLGPHHLELSHHILLKDVHGRPNVPKGFLGSISHKRNIAVAIVAVGEHEQSRPTMGIGIDIEEANATKSSIARKVLTKNEISDLGSIQGMSSDEEVLLRFSIKESLYKAMHPLICQYVGFQEAEVRPLSDGTVQTFFHLKSGAHENFGMVTAHWRRHGNYFLSTSSVRLQEK